MYTNRDWLQGEFKSFELASSSPKKMGRITISATAGKNHCSSVALVTNGP